MYQFPRFSIYFLFLFAMLNFEFRLKKPKSTKFQAASPIFFSFPVHFGFTIFNFWLQISELASQKTHKYQFSSCSINFFCIFHSHYLLFCYFTILTSFATSDQKETHTYQFSTPSTYFFFPILDQSRWIRNFEFSNCDSKFVISD